MNHLTFEAAKEILRDSVVIGISLSGHALDHMESSQLLAIGIGGVLDAAISTPNMVWYLLSGKFVILVLLSILHNYIAFSLCSQVSGQVCSLSL